MRFVVVFWLLNLAMSNAWGQVNAAASDSLELPESAVQILDAQYDSWKICQEGYLGMAPDSTAILWMHRNSLKQGDFNSDGLADYALQIKIGSPRTLLIALIQEENSFAHFVVDERRERSPTCMQNIDVLKAGSGDYDYDSGQYFEYEHDAVFLYWPEKGGVSFVWNGEGFEELITSV